MERTGQFVEGAEAVWGSNDVESLFPGGSAVAGAPWPRAARKKNRRSYDQDLVKQELERPVDGPHGLVDVDPRNLQSTQPNITRAGVEHYMGDEYEKTGRTFADQSNVGNQFPFVYSRRNEASNTVDEMLLSGHHRAASALLKGKSLRARRIEGPWGEAR